MLPDVPSVTGSKLPAPGPPFPREPVLHAFTRRWEAGILPLCTRRRAVG